jgi:hypothetical protein
MDSTAVPVAWRKMTLETGGPVAVTDESERLNQSCEGGKVRLEVGTTSLVE